MLLVLRLMRLLPLILLGISALLCQGSHLFLISSFLNEMGTAPYVIRVGSPTDSVTDPGKSYPRIMGARRKALTLVHLFISRHSLGEGPPTPTPYPTSVA